MFWIRLKGKFTTDNPDLFIHNLQILLQQTRTSYKGEIQTQEIFDVECTAIKVETEKSEQMEVVKDNESSEKMDISAKEEVMEPSSQETEK